MFQAELYSSGFGENLGDNHGMRFFLTSSSK